MIDGLKSFRVSAFAENIHRNATTWEKKEGIKNNEATFTYKYCGLHIKVCNGKVSMYGSIHKYFNNGSNSNDFSHSQLIEALNKLWEQFGINPHCTELNGIEIGVNINYSPSTFINSIIDYKGEAINITKKDFLYSECEMKSRYTMKAYTKESLLRIEIAFNRTEDLRRKGIKFLSDVTTPENYKIMGEMLLKQFDNYFTIDNTALNEEIKPNERELLRDGQNPRYWNNLHITNPENYKKKRARFKELCDKYKLNNGKKEVRKLIEEKILQLSEPTKTFPELTVCRYHEKLETFPELTKSKEPQRNNEPLIKEDDFPRSNTLDEVLKRGICSNVDSSKVCPITGLSISMQKDESKFICSTGVKWYLEHDNETYERILYKRIAKSKYKNSTIDIQIREIHHSVRNEFNNCLHNYKRDSKKRGSQLFEDYEYYSDKLKKVCNR